MGLFIGNLQPGTTTSDLLDFMEDHEGITDIEIVKRRSEQGEVRFGHILFRSGECVAKAIKLQQKRDLHGAMVSVREFVSRADNERRSAGQPVAQPFKVDRRQGDRRHPAGG